MSEMKLSVKLRLANEQFVSALSAAVGDFRTAMDALKVSAETAGNSVDGSFKNLGIRSGATIKAEVDKIKASFATLRDSDLGFADKERASAALNARLRELGRELGSVSGQAKASGSAMQQAGQSSQSMSSSLAHAGHVMAELYVAWAALNGAFRLSKSILDAGIGLDKIMAQLQFAAGSAEGAAESMAFVRAEAERLGIDVGAAGEGFAKFAASVRGSSLEGQKARDVFSGVADAAKVMQLSADETKGIFLALSQMMAKGKVQAEEFRGQLGDRLPIATSVAAKALGVTTAEFSRMLDAGELVSEDFLPRFAAALKENVSGALPAAVNTLDAQIARMKNAWTEAMQEIAKSGAMDEVGKIAGELAAKIRAMSESGELQKFGKEFADAMKTAGEAIVGVTAFVVEHAEAIKGLLIVYAELRALSFVKSFADMAVGLIGVSTAANTAGASVSGLGKQLALLPARLTIVLGIAVVGIGLYQQVTGFIDGIIEGQRKIDEAGRKAVSPVDVQYMERAREARDALEEINKKYFSGSDQSAMSTGKIIGDFRKLTVEAKGTGQALDEMVKKVNFSDSASIDKMLASMDTLKRAGLVTGEEIRNSIGGALAKLSTTDFVEFQNSALRAFDGSVEGARKLGIALEASLADGFKRLGGDIDKFRTGIDQATKNAIAGFDLIAENAQASGREIGEAFNLALKTADTRKEVDALGESLKKAAADGVISGKDLEDAQTRLQAKLNETAGVVDSALGDAFKRMGIKSKAELKALADQAKADFEAIKKSGAATAEGVAAAEKKYNDAKDASLGLKKAVAGVADESARAAQESSELADGISQAAASINDAGSGSGSMAKFINDFMSGAKELYQQLGLSKQAIDEIFLKSIDRSMDWGRAMQNAIEIYEQAVAAVDRQKKSLSDAAAETQRLGAYADDVTRNFNATVQAAYDLALGMHSAASAGASMQAGSTDPAINAALQQQWAAAEKLAQAYVSIERSARSAAKSAEDAVRGFVSSSRSIHEELLTAQGKEDQAAASRFAARKAELEISYKQLQMQIMIAEVQARAAGIDTGELSQAKAEAAAAFAQAKNDLLQLEKIDAERRKKAKQDAANDARDAAAKAAQDKAAADAASRQLLGNLVKPQPDNSAYGAAQAATSAAGSQARMSAGNTNTVNIYVDGSDLLSEDQIRRKVVPVIEDIMRKSR